MGAGAMRRIGKADHAAILHKVDVERRKVAEVAAEYGCTPANIYALLSKLRRAAPEPVVAPEPAPEPVPAVAAVAVDADLFAVAAPAPQAPAPRPNVSATVTELPRRGVAKDGVGAAKAKPGVALMMRTAEGEETSTPFRSLDDLLSAVKPILRAAARSPDAVWFCIQPVDLAALDSDAA